MPYPKEDLFNFQRVCTKVVQPSGAKWGKTGKTAVLPGFCKKERDTTESLFSYLSIWDFRNL